MVIAQELQALTLASFFVRHNLSGVATADLCTLIKTLCPDNENIRNLSEQQINALTNDLNIKVVHTVITVATPSQRIQTNSDGQMRATQV